jgi:CRISPR-associated endonuclease/helicase Cas3
VNKPRESFATQDVDAWAAKIIDEFRKSAKGKLTLVVVNTVRRAAQLHAAIAQGLKGELPAECLHLVHSRFRPAEREQWREAFLRRDAVIPSSGRIVIATQVVEAGVDLDASLLLTELAPWPSLVQRFGRAARGGGTARVIVLDPGHTDEKRALPYDLGELASAREALASVDDVSPLRIEAFERGLDDAQRARLYPYAPRHLLLRHEWQELFDTTADLTGADLDVSRFIRSGDERDVQVFWQDLPDDASPPAGLQPAREALCSVPFLAARDWLCAVKSERLAPNKRAWVWDFIDGNWLPARRSQLIPGRVVLVSSESGGYTPLTGFAPESRARVTPVPVPSVPADELADASQDGEDLSAAAWKTIGTHGGEVAQTALLIAEATGLPPALARALSLAGKWHDLGKSHPAFQGCIRSAQRPLRTDLAKAPNDAWPAAKRYRSENPPDHRPGFRHELASALALLSVLARHAPTHPALLGPWLEVFAALKTPVETAASGSAAPTADEREVLDLSDREFDLVAFLVASHHGKVRGSLHSAPADQEYADQDGRGFPVRGVREGDVLPATELTPGATPLPPLRLTLEPAALGLSSQTGRSWGERVSLLLQEHGPATLAFLEACLRAADIRASRLPTPDPLLTAAAQSAAQLQKETP